MKDVILTLRERGKTILLCSHLLADVEEICNRVSILYGGKQRAAGAVGDLLTAHEFTQIRSPRLTPATLDKVLAIIRQDPGAGGPVEVGAPTQRLEDYFLNVVREARRERLVTEGAEVGAGTAVFLGGRESVGEDLLEELIKSDQPGPGAPGHVPEPVRSVPTMVDEVLLEELAQMGAAEQSDQGDAVQGVRAAAAPEAKVRQDVLSELLTDGDAGKKADEDKAH
jgi:ABC-2 type transport system ATP-binding protein